ncbi:MAG: thioredoxin family protein [Thermodesulfobacteriota bacterium]|nr:thioredoxin family protein [Thermodesulfobacteriota bacterium]
MITPEEEKQITTWNSGLAGAREIHLLFTEDKRTSQLEDFCKDLVLLAPKVQMVQKEEEHMETPAIGIGPGLRYHAVPLGTELGPFLEAVSDSDKSGSRLSPTLLRGLEQITVPAALSLFVAPQCPHCPVTARQLLPLASASEAIRLRVIDGVLFPEIAQSHHIRSVPTVVLDEQFRWTGTVELKELVEVMTNRDPADLSASSLEGMLKEGDASQVASMMLEREMIFPAFIDLLAHEKMFVRLGAMVVMEEIVERNRALAAQVVDPLLERFDEAGDRAQGDILYVLGESGNASLMPALEMILQGSFHVEVKEAAQEALEKIKASW